MSNRYTDLPLTSYPNEIDVIKSRTDESPTYFKRWEDYKDIMFANHIKCLQDAIVAIERTLGALPSGTKNNIKERLDDIESRLLTMNDVNSAINAHKHTGDSNSPSKIDLSSEVQGKLKFENIDLNFNNASSIKASNIYYSADMTIEQKINNLQDYINQAVLNLTSKITDYKIATDFILNNGKLSTFDSAYNKSAVKNSVKGSTGNIIKMCEVTTNPLIYNRYVACIRVFVSSPINTTQNIIMSVKAGTKNGTMSVVSFPYSYFNYNSWNYLYVMFDHYYVANSEDKVTVSIYYNSSTQNDIYVDNVIITPTHTAVYSVQK